MAKCSPGCTCDRHVSYSSKCPPDCTCGKHRAFSEERRRKMGEGQKKAGPSEAKKEFLKKAAVPQLCACGCGEYTKIDTRRNRVGKYVSGHNSRVAHPMKGRHHTEEVRTKLAGYTGESASSYRHGWSDTLTYKSWNAMRSRCRDESNASWSQYGGRGITVCERWHLFENFLEDMGERPSKDYQIDRRDPDGNYEPSNCRWITRAENNARRKDPGGWIARRASQVKKASES